MGSGGGQKMSLTKQTQQNILNTTTGDKMKVGDLVKCIYSHELFVIISEEVMMVIMMCMGLEQGKRAHATRTLGGDKMKVGTFSKD